MRGYPRVAVALAAASLTVLAWSHGLGAQVVATTRASVATDGTEANGQSSIAAISADGRYVLFNSGATNLVPGDTNRTGDAFVRDRQAGTTTRVSVATGGAEANNDSYGTALSADGRFVAFTSWATNLDAADANGVADAFVHDRVSGTTARMSVALGGGDPNGRSASTALSADGRYVVIESRASNLVAGDSNGWGDVFVRDRHLGTTTRVSVATDGTQANAESEYSTIDPSGRYVGFCTRADTLTPGETFGLWDVYVHDRQTGITTRVSATPTGNEPNDGSAGLGFSGEDARYVAYGSAASDIVTGDTNRSFDSFLLDRHVGTTTRVSVAIGSMEGDDNSYRPVISASGRWVAFNSYATNLVPGDTNEEEDVFVVDQFRLGQPGSVTRASITTHGGQADSGSHDSVLNASGRYVAFTSWASNLVPGDANDRSDVFVHDRGPALTAPSSLVTGGANTLTGVNFTAGTVIMLFVATAGGADAYGPFTPLAWTSTALTWIIPPEVPLGNGFGTIQAINTDTDYWESNRVSALLEGDPASGIPTILYVDGVGLGPADPGIGVAHIDTVVAKGGTATITGTGFGDPQVNLFTAAGNVGPLAPLAGASVTQLQVVVPAGAPTGPGNFQVVNRPSYRASNAVSAVVGAVPTVTSVTVSGSTITVTGTGFSTLSVINLFNLQGSGVVNLGGLGPSGAALVPLTLVSDTQFTFTRPAGAAAGPAFVEVLNPPFIPFSSSGSDPDGAFTMP